MEWIPPDDGGGDEWPMLLRRNDVAIQQAYNEFWDKIRWNRHQVWLQKIRTGEEPLTEEQKPLLQRAKREARRIERKYGDMIVNHLTEHGVMGAALLYESPFIDITPRGPEGLFDPTAIDELVAVLDHVRASAMAA